MLVNCHKNHNVSISSGNFNIANVQQLEKRSLDSYHRSETCYLIP